MVQCGDNMKRNIIFILCNLLLVEIIFAVDWKMELEKNFISEESISLGSYEYGNIYTRVKDCLTIKYNLENKYLQLPEKIWIKYYADITLPDSMNIYSDFYLRNDGFLYGKIANEPFSSEPVQEVPVILGNEFSFAIPGVILYTLEFGEEKFKKNLSFYEKCEKETKVLYHGRVYNDVFVDVKSSSHLVEDNRGIKIDYCGKNLDWYITKRGRELATDILNEYCFPWVENADGPGVGEWIEFELNSPQSITYILNGFVDGHRMHLYKANSRLKEAEITGWTENGKEIKQNVHFEDFVYFKTVQFSEPVIKFRITIKEAYPGDKWQDTCISAVMFPVEKK